MGGFEQSLGDTGNGRYVRLLGQYDELSLDNRGRFRLPDNLVYMVRQELGRVRADEARLNQAPALERLAFYLVPGTRQRVFLYPVPNIDLAVQRFEDPPADMPDDVIRRARDYFYYRMRFVEADKQNRLAIPDGLREHGDIGEGVSHVSLIAHNHWLALTRSDLVEKQKGENLEAFKQVAGDLLDPARPVRSRRPGEQDSSPE